METGITTYKPQTAVEKRRELAKIPAVMEALEPLEKSVFLASTAKTIAEYESVELGTDLAKALKFIAKDVGYRETSESSFWQYLVARTCEILKRYYGALTMRDFRMAFEMSITGELDDYLPKGRDGQPDRGHYQQFNAEYICKILNAYKMRRAAILRKAIDAAGEPEPERDVDKERELLNRKRLDCINAYISFKESGQMPELSPIDEMLFYEILTDAGLAPEIFVTAEEQKAVYQRTINHYARNGMVGDMRRLKEVGPEAAELQHGAKTLARRRALKETFEKLAAMGMSGVEIRNYIKII